MLHMSNDLNNAAITATNDIPELVSTGEVSLGGSMTRQVRSTLTPPFLTTGCIGRLEKPNADGH